MQVSERRAQILRFSKSFQLNQEQEQNYIHRLSSLLENHHLNKWFEKEPLEETSIVIWHQILDFSEHAICTALNLTSGTFRYRLSRGLSSLGKSL